MKPSVNPPSARAGFTLVEVVVVMLIFAVVIAMVAVMTRGVSAAQRRSLTATRIAGVEAALVQFVLTQRRLPCPADGTKPSSDNDAGIEENRNAAGCIAAGGEYERNGVVPWRALALSETEVTDGWERRLTYRVYPTLAADNGMNMSMCDPAGTEPGGANGRACNLNCVSTNLALCTMPGDFLGTKGILVTNVGGAILMNPGVAPNTGAAYVIISAGESGGGGYLNTGILGTSSIGDGTEELRNYASLPYVLNVTSYVDDGVNDAATTAHYDDIVARPSIMSIATKAGLGPRAH